MDANENATLAPCSHFDRNLGAFDSILNSDFLIDAEGSEDLGLTFILNDYATAFVSGAPGGGRARREAASKAVNKAQRWRLIPSD